MRSPLVALLVVAGPVAALADVPVIPKADVTIQLRADDNPHADDSALLALARKQALEQVLRGRLGDALVNENRERIMAALEPEPSRFLRPVVAHHTTQVNSLGFSDDIFVAAFSVDAAIGPVMQRLSEELAKLPHPRLLIVRGDGSREDPRLTKGKAPQHSGTPSPPEAKGRPGDSFEQLATRLEGKLSAASWRCLSVADASARLKGRPVNDLEALRAVGEVGDGDVVLFLESGTSGETGAVPGLTNIHTEVAWRAVEALSGDLLGAGARVFSTPTVTESFERGYEAAALGVEEQLQGAVLDAWRKHSDSTGGVVVLINGVDFEVLAQLRAALGKVEGTKILDASLNDGSAQVRLETAQPADQIASKVVGLKLGKGVAKVSRVSPGRVELMVK